MVGRFGILNSILAGWNTNAVQAELVQKSKWAYLPVGPLERHLREGIQGGILGRGPETDPQKGIVTFTRWDILGKPLLITN